MTARSSRFYSALQLAAHRLQKRADAALMDAGGISTAQAAVLTLISAQPGLKQNTLAEALGLNESAVTAMIARLQKMDLVRKARSAEDARAVELTLTDTGEKTLAAIRAPFAEINALIDEVLGEEVDRIGAALTALSSAAGPQD